MQTYINANRKEDAPPFEDISRFMPHPQEYRLAARNQQIQCTAKGAIAFMATLDDLPVSILCVFDNWLEDLELLASSG